MAGALIRDLETNGRNANDCHVISGACALVCDTVTVNTAVLLVRLLLIV